MLLSITTTHQPATDLGFLLHKHPDRCQTFDLSFGRAMVFYPEASVDRCEMCLLLDVDPVHLVRGKAGSLGGGLLDQYVNDRPYVASSFMSVALSQVLGTAMSGRSRERPELADRPLPLTVRIEVLPVRGGPDWLQRIFAPLGYEVTHVRHPLDPTFPAWGESHYYSVELRHCLPIARLLQHLYVLIPVFDDRKHYYVGPDEVQKLLVKGADWLGEHPEREAIAQRYLARRPSLVRQTLARLVAEDEAEVATEATGDVATEWETAEGSTTTTTTTDVGSDGESEATPNSTSTGNLHSQRLTAVLEVLRSSGAQRILDLGCGEGKLLRRLMAERQFTEIVGMDVSIRALEIAHRRLKLDRLPEHRRDRVRLVHGALTYRDARLEGFDAAALVEVIEHLDLPRFVAMERVVFEHIRPATIVVTTPNREYNVVWETLPEETMRHADHRFEWTRDEFAAWAHRVADRFGYRVQLEPVGPEHALYGSPSQMAVFQRT